MDFWNLLSAELLQNGYSPRVVKQLQAQFGALDAPALMRVPREDIVSALNKVGSAISMDEAALVLKLAREIARRMDEQDTPRPRPAQPAQPTSESIRFMLRFSDSGTGKKQPLANARIRVQHVDSEGEPDRDLFKGRSSARGEIQFTSEPAQAHVEVFGVDNHVLYEEVITLTSKQAHISISLDTSDYQTRLDAPLTDLEAELGQAIPQAVEALYKQTGVSTLADLRLHADELRKTRGLTGADKRAHLDMLAHAELQLISRDFKLNQALIEANFRNVHAISKMSPASFTAAVDGQIDSRTAIRLYESATSVIECLKNELLVRKVEEANGFGKDSDSQPCPCGCQSAVSPMAYLADLIDLAMRSVTYHGTPLRLGELEKQFHQPFASLPTDCIASEELVRQVRICIEVLYHKAFAEGHDLSANEVIAGHARRAYEALLTALGTSSRELRLLRTTTASPEARQRKAQALGIDAANLDALLLLENPQPLNGITPPALSEVQLETLFGLQDTSRDPLSFGARWAGSDTDVVRWQLRGVEWARNTDSRGTIYGSLTRNASHINVTLYKDSDRSQQVATASGEATGDDTDLALTPQNASQLYGRLLIRSSASDQDFELAVVPEFLIWRFSHLSQQWRTEDYPEPLYDPQLPIVDPDMLTANHFAAPHNASNPAYALWEQRQTLLRNEQDALDNLSLDAMLTEVLGIAAGDWEDITADLQSADETVVRARLDDLAALHLSVEGFHTLNAERSQPDPLTISDEALRNAAQARRLQVIDILMNVKKRRDMYPDWVAEEASIALSPAFFSLPPESLAAINPARVSGEQVGQWLSELERNSKAPIIDPDILGPVLNIGSAAGVAGRLYTDRLTELNTIQDVLNAVSANTLDLTWLDARLGNQPLRQGSTTVLHGLGLPNLNDLQSQFENKQLDMQPQQHGLTAHELGGLLTIRKLVAEGQADAHDWQHVFHILIQAEKRRHKYPRWRSDEASAGLTLSPEFFPESAQSLVKIVAADPRDSALLEWRSNRTVLREWQSRLDTRYQQQRAASDSLRAAIDNAEEASLPALRDALIDALFAGNQPDVRKRNATNALLINAFESVCRKTTRVAQATETMQLLLWGIVNDQIEDQEFSIPEANREVFDSNWRWLRSYATWRSALFIFLYPENLLLPRLRPNSTPVFQAIIAVLDGTAQPSPPAPDGDEQSSANSSSDNEGGFGVDLFKTFVQNAANKIFDRLAGVSPLSSKGLDIIYESVPDLRPNLIGAPDEVEDPPLETLFFIPLHFATVMQQQGDYETALEWFGKVYDLNRNRLLAHIEDLLPSSDSPTTRYYNAEEWLTDRLNPHLIAMSRRDVHLRYIRMAIITCLLDFAEAEFTTDTAESLARARELYLSALRMLDLPGLKQNLEDCDVETLRLQLGEEYADQPEVIDEVDAGLRDPRLRDDPVRFADLLRDLRAALPIPRPGRRPGTRPGPDPSPEAISDLFNRHRPTQPVMSLEERQQHLSLRQNSLIRDLLNDDSLLFRSLQEMADAPPSGNGARRRVAFANINMPGRIIQPDLTRVPDAIRDAHITIPSVVFEFCIPPNPMLALLRLRTEIGLFKLNNCMNLSGLRREVPAYSAPTDVRGGLTAFGASGVVPLPQMARIDGTQYRYRVLVERAKQLVQIAEQMEGSYLSFLEKLDAEQYNIRRANHDLTLANANVALQALRLTEAEHGQDLAEEQWNKANEALSHFEDLLAAGLLPTEETALTALQQASVMQSVGVAAGAITNPGSVLSSAGGAMSTIAQFNMTFASFERREQEWQFQRDLSEIDVNIAEAQQTLADDHFNIVEQEQNIANIGADNAKDMLGFLSNKFTNADLYYWMSGVISGIYSYFLQQATAIAKVAQMQLAFERQEANLDFISDDYWVETTNASVLAMGATDDPDRRGMTGSARLLKDIFRMDQYAFLTDRRKLQLSKTISLALHDPVAFQQFLQSGVLPFRTTLEQFDRDFPGHYLRLIKRVRTSVIALIPPTQGIRAVLSSTSISKVVTGAQSTTVFDETSIPHQLESVALSAATNDMGIFDLQEQAEMLLPFEGLGVAQGWEFRLPRAANPFDFTTIADVLVTIDYTALDSPVYRQQVIQSLDPVLSAERPFSFRHQFADAWYDLHHSDLLPNQEPEKVKVAFATGSEDFPPNLSQVRIEHLTVFIIYKPDVPAEDKLTTVDLGFRMHGQSTRIGGAATAHESGLVGTRQGGAGSWMALIGKPPVGEWTLTLDKEEMVDLFRNDQIEDILFVITFGGTTPVWPG